MALSLAACADSSGNRSRDDNEQGASVVVEPAEVPDPDVAGETPTDAQPSEAAGAESTPADEPAQAAPSGETPAAEPEPAPAEEVPAAEPEPTPTEEPPAAQPEPAPTEATPAPAENTPATDLEPAPAEQTPVTEPVPDPQPEAAAAPDLPADDAPQLESSVPDIAPPNVTPVNSPGPLGTGGSFENLNDGFVSNEPSHNWLQGNWELEFGDDFSGNSLDESLWNYFEEETHRVSYSCSDNNEGYCSGDNFVRHSSRLDRNHTEVSNGALMMDVTAAPDENKVQMSFLQTWDTKSPGWETRLKEEDTGEGFRNTFFGVEEGPLYIEASVNFSKAYPAVGAWWAFWLYSPDTWMTPVDRWCEGQIPARSCTADRHPSIFNQPGDLDTGFCRQPSGYGVGCTFFANANDGLYLSYEENFDPTDNYANTGMEVDIFEYAPDVSIDGFNIALYKTHRYDTESPDSFRQKGLRPNGDHFTAPKTHDYLLSSSREQYQNDQRIINLSEDRYHRLGMYWDSERYSFYLDGYHMWTVTDTAWITQQRRNGLRLSWEHSHDLWTRPNPGSIPDTDGDGIPQARTFLNAGENPKVYIDYVKVLRKQ